MAPTYHRWSHVWAVLTVCAAFPLILLGAGVTSTGSGMVDPQGLRVPWHLLLVDHLRERGLGFLIEHSHRTAGWIVGVAVIVLAVSLWVQDSRPWVRWLGALALAGVSAQGMLGRYRVDLNAVAGPWLALVHGLFAQLVFALLVSLALCTSRGWLRPAAGRPRPGDAAALRRLALLLPTAVYVQIAFGAFVRHTNALPAPRLHAVFAFAVVAVVVWLAAAVWRLPFSDRGLRRSVRLLVALVGVQVYLGVESWLGKFPASPAWPQLRPLGPYPELLRSLHYVVGSLVFATAVVAALRVCRVTGAGADFAAERNGVGGLHDEPILSGGASRLGGMEGRP
jgi:cytochrome c oxidase assembly protein subunit 15